MLQVHLFGMCLLYDSCSRAEGKSLRLMLYALRDALTQIQGCTCTLVLAFKLEYSTLTHQNCTQGTEWKATSYLSPSLPLEVVKIQCANLGQTNLHVPPPAQA